MSKFSSYIHRTNNAAKRIATVPAKVHETFNSLNENLESNPYIHNDYTRAQISRNLRMKDKGYDVNK